MANPIKITLDTSQYKSPTQQDINAAKQFILRRNEYAILLGDKIDDLLEDAAVQIVTICYRHNIDPKKFTISSKYNEQMMDEISEVMDDLEEGCLELIDDYSSSVLDDSQKDRKTALLLWLATLGRGNRNFKDTLDGYLLKTLKDWEAAIAALRYADVKLADAITKVKTHLHSIYTMPEVLSAFKEAEDFEATFIRNRGVNPGAVGLSNNGSTNVTNMAKTTLQMAWMREHKNDFEGDGAVGYYVLRGSGYPCDLCDSMVGFHPISDIEGFPPYHPSCCCYVIPIYSLNESIQEKEEEQQNEPAHTPDDLPGNLFDVYEDAADDVSFKIAKGIDKDKSDYADLLNIAKEFAKMGESVAILKPYHVKSEEYRMVFGTLKGTKYWGKNPDLLVGDKFYEYESFVQPWKKRKVANMISDGMAQSENIIIDNNGGATERFIRRAVYSRINVGANINEFWIYENGVPKNLLKRE